MAFDHLTHLHQQKRKSLPQGPLTFLGAHKGPYSMEPPTSPSHVKQV